jgi:hypothetical protein
VSLLLELAKKFGTYHEWLGKLLDAEVKSVTTPLPTKPECRNARLERTNGSSITFGQLLADLAPDESIRAIVNEDNFWTREALYLRNAESGPGLLRVLHSYYMLEDKDPLKNGLRLFAGNAMAFLFAELGDSRREIYFDSLQQFRLKIMRTLEPRTGKQKKVFKRIVKILDWARETVKNFPAAGTIRIKGMPVPISAGQKLSTVHAALITQLRIAIRIF